MDWDPTGKEAVHDKQLAEGIVTVVLIGRSREGEDLPSPPFPPSTGTQWLCPLKGSGEKYRAENRRYV